jgi:hypothetical protein
MGENPRVYSASWTFFKKEVRLKELKKYPGKLEKRQEVYDEGK